MKIDYQLIHPAGRPDIVAALCDRERLGYLPCKHIALVSHDSDDEIVWELWGNFEGDWKLNFHGDESREMRLRGQQGRVTALQIGEAPEVGEFGFAVTATGIYGDEMDALHFLAPARDADAVLVFPTEEAAKAIADGAWRCDPITMGEWGVRWLPVKTRGALSFPTGELNVTFNIGDEISEITF